MLFIILIIITVWNQFTFSNYQEIIVFFPLLVLYFNQRRYELLKEEGINISYYNYEFIIFLLLLSCNFVALLKIYFEYF